MTYRNRRLINLFVIFNRERLAIVLFIKLITLLVNFLKASSRVICFTVCIFSPICIRCFLRRHHLLIKRFPSFSSAGIEFFTGIQRRFKLTKAIIEIFAIHDQIFIIRFDIVDHPPTIAGCRLKRVKFTDQPDAGVPLLVNIAENFTGLSFVRSVQAVRNLPTDRPSYRDRHWKGHRLPLTSGLITLSIKIFLR